MPAEAPVLETKPTFGLAEPESFAYPKEHQLWTPATYDNFNVSKGVDVKDKSVMQIKNSKFEKVPWKIKQIQILLKQRLSRKNRIC